MAITISGENNNDRILASDGVIDSLSGFNVVGVITATSFTGDLTGDVTGNLTGNVTGNINNSTLLLQTGGNERIRITSGGNVLLNGGSLKIDGSGEFAVYESDTSLGFNNSAQISLDFSSNVARVRSTASGSGTNRPLALCIGSTEKLRIDTNGNVGIKSTAPRGKLDIQFDGAPSFITFGADADNPKVEFFRNTGGSPSHYATEFQQILGDFVISTAAIANLGSHSYSEKLRIDSSGRVLIGGTSNSASSHADELQVINTSAEGGISIINGTSSTGHIYFGDTDAAAQGRIDYNHGGDYMRFFTNGNNERLRITSGGDIITQGLTNRSFNNDGNNAKVLEVTGDGTVGEYGVLNLSGNQNSSAAVGAIKFINRENSNSSSGGNANSKALATIDVFADTSDSNAGDDCGGFMRFVTKADGGGNAERLRITSAGQFLVGATSSTGARGIIQQNSSDTNPLDQQTCADSSGMRLQNYSFGVGRYTALSLECANSSTVQSASIIAQSVSSGQAPDIIIAQRTSNSANTEKLRIGSNGSMYLGYNASDGLPVQDGAIPGNLRLFSIHGTGTSLGIKLTNSSTGTTTGDGLDIRLHGYTAMINQNEAYDLQLRSKGELAFRTGNPHAERLRIESDGDFRLSSDNAGTNYGGIRGWNSSTGDMIIDADKSATGTGTSKSNLIFRSRGSEKLRIKSDGELVINHTQSSAPLNNTFLSIYDANSDSSAIDASGISKNYAMISLHNYGTGVSGDTTGIGFGAGSAFSYTKGSIAFTRSGGYGTGDLVFLTNNDQDTTMVNDTDERMRITRDGKIKLGSGGDPVANVEIRYDNPVLLIRDTAETSADNDAKIAFGNNTHYPTAYISHIWDGTNGALTFHTRIGGNEYERLRITANAHILFTGGASQEVAFGTTDNTKYAGFGRHDGAAQDVGLNFYTTTNAGTTFVNHFRIDHNGDLLGTDTNGVSSISDSRVKTDITDYTYDVEKFKQFAPKQFNWKNPEYHGEKTNVKGFVAQDLEAIDTQWVGSSFIEKDHPDYDLVDKSKNGQDEDVGVVKTSKFGGKDAMYISVINQMIAKIETLEAEVSALKSS